VSEEELIGEVRSLREAVDARLEALVPPPEQAPAELHRSIRHTLLAPGKRVRAVMAMLAARQFGGRPEAGLSSACALEMVHAASLILDDLPAMDDASLRRGLTTNHQLYGEATAMLAAIALLNRAFGVIAEDETLDPGQRTMLSQVLSRSIGSEGLVAGQQQDLKWSSEDASQDDVTLVHARKTAALFSAAAEMGAIAAAASAESLEHMRAFGLKLGLAFQILDDLIDALSDSQTAGKDVSQDRGRPSMVLTVGADQALADARKLIDEAETLMARSGSDEMALRHFAMWLVAGLENKLKAR